MCIDTSAIRSLITKTADICCGALQLISTCFFDQSVDSFKMNSPSNATENFLPEQHRMSHDPNHDPFRGSLSFVSFRRGKGKGARVVHGARAWNGQLRGQEVRVQGHVRLKSQKSLSARRLSNSPINYDKTWPPYFHLATSEVWCWSGGRIIFK